MRTAYIEIIMDCNLKCTFCSRGKDEGICQVSEIKQLINKYVAQGYGKIYFTGGEPLLFPNLEAIVAYGASKSPEMTIQTNGILMTKEKAKLLKEAGVCQVIFSIHSHLPEIEDELMGGSGVLKQQLKGLLNAHNAGIITYVTVVLSKQNFATLPQYFKFMFKNYPFVDHYTINFVDALGRALSNRDVVPKLSDVEFSLAKALLLLKKAGKSFRVERVPLCYLLEFAEYNTELRRISTKEDSVVFRRRESVGYTDGYFEREYVRGKACHSCTLKTVCPGVDKDYAEIYGTKELYPLFVDPKKIVAKAGRD
ncbi:MAG: radical SAM protein [Candidatus Altiarchaeota archaeon]|nr:radical SAM protein [Candidatus Altiarchaeota archaeon]